MNEWHILAISEKRVVGRDVTGCICVRLNSVKWDV